MKGKKELIICDTNKIFVSDNYLYLKTIEGKVIKLNLSNCTYEIISYVQEHIHKIGIKRTYLRQRFLDVKFANYFGRKFDFGELIQEFIKYKLVNYDSREIRVFINLAYNVDGIILKDNSDFYIVDMYDKLTSQDKKDIENGLQNMIDSNSLFITKKYRKVISKFDLDFFKVKIQYDYSYEKLESM